MLPKRAKHMSDFMWQALFGTLGFLFFLGLAVLLAFLVHLMKDETWVPQWLISGAEWVEFTLFWADVVSFAGFVLYELWVFGGGLIADRNER